MSAKHHVLFFLNVADLFSFLAKINNFKAISVAPDGCSVRLAPSSYRGFLSCGRMKAKLLLLA